MFLYLVFIFIILILGYIYRNNKKMFCITAGIFLLGIYFLKVPTLGNSDTVSLYIPNFYAVQSMSFSQVIYNYRHTDFFFYLLTKVFTLFSNNLNVYFGICSIPLIYSVVKLVYKYSKKPLLSILIFFTIFYPWMFIIVRHSVAWGFLLLSIDYYFSNKKIKCLLFILIASLFHKTALSFLLIFIFNKINNRYFQIFSLIVMFLLCYFFTSDVNKLIYSFINSGHYSLYENKESYFSILRYLVFIMIYVFILIFVRKESSYSTFEKNVFNIYWGGCLFLTLSFVTWDFFRISMYFSILTIVFVPNIIDRLSYSNRKILSCLIIILLTMYGINVYDLLGLLPLKFGFI